MTPPETIVERVAVSIEPATAQRLMDWGVLHFTDEGWTIDFDIWGKNRAAIEAMSGEGDRLVEREAVVRWLKDTADTAARMWSGDENANMRRHLVGTLLTNAEAIAKGDHRKPRASLHQGNR